MVHLYVLKLRIRKYIESKSLEIIWLLKEYSQVKEEVSYELFNINRMLCIEPNWI